MPSRHLPASGLAALLLVLVGCSQPTGPVFGEWQGNQPGSSADASTAVDLVLEGGPAAQSGQYHITTTMQDPNQLSNNGTQQWGGRWSSEQRETGDHTIMVVTLHDHLASQIGTYALEADGKLHALEPNGKLDSSPASALYTLSPVQPRGHY